MKRYIINQVITLHSGVVELSKEQALSRLHNLNALDDGRFEIVRPVMFKAGEVIGFDGDMPKNFAGSMEDIALAPAKRKAKSKTEALADAETTVVVE